MSNIPITFATPWYGKFAGGAEVAARTLAEQLSQRGFYVQVLTTCCPSPFDSWWQNKLSPGVEKLNGVIVRRFPVNNKGEELFHEANYRVICGMKINEELQRQFVDNSINSQALVEYAQANTQGHLVIGLPYTQGLIYSLVQSLEGRASIMPCFHNEPQFQWITTAEMLAASKHFFFLTEEEKTLSIRFYGDYIGRRLVESPVVGVGVELPSNIDSLIADNSIRNEIKTKYNLPAKFFVYVGRKDVGKNVLMLIDYFKKYLTNSGDATLVFLGGGDANLVPREKGFLDLGYLPETDKYLIISQSLGLINLSQNESFSIVIMEAWLCEIPVIVHQESTVTTAHCRKSQGGIPILSSDEFEDALRVLSSQDISKALGKAGQHYVQHNYSWDCVLDRLLRGAYSG